MPCCSGIKIRMGRSKRNMTYFSAGEAANRIRARLLRGLARHVDDSWFWPVRKSFRQNLWLPENIRDLDESEMMSFRVGSKEDESPITRPTSSRDDGIQIHITSVEHYFEHCLSW